MASAAIPGVFPPVKIDGEVYFDGSVANNTPISAALELGAESIVVLPTGYSCEMKRPPTSALAMALHGVNLLIARQLVIDVERFMDQTQIRVVPAALPGEHSPVRLLERRPSSWTARSSARAPGSRAAASTTRAFRSSCRRTSTR